MVADPGPARRRASTAPSPATACSTRRCSARRRAASATTPRLARRVRGARDVDDVEVRAAAAAVRRREGRRPLRPARAVAGGARAHHAPLHVRARRHHRPEDRHPRAGHGDERADDGVDDGHVLDAAGLRGAGDRHRQADLDRRLDLPARGDRRRRRDGDRARVRAARLASSPTSAASSRASATSAASRPPSSRRAARR